MANGKTVLKQILTPTIPEQGREGKIPKKLLTPILNNVRKEDERIRQLLDESVALAFPDEPAALQSTSNADTFSVDPSHSQKHSRNAKSGNDRSTPKFSNPSAALSSALRNTPYLDSTDSPLYGETGHEQVSNSLPATTKGNPEQRGVELSMHSYTTTPWGDEHAYILITDRATGEQYILRGGNNWDELPPRLALIGSGSSSSGSSGAAIGAVAGGPVTSVVGGSAGSSSGASSGSSSANGSGLPGFELIAEVEPKHKSMDYRYGEAIGREIKQVEAPIVVNKSIDDVLAQSERFVKAVNDAELAYTGFWRNSNSVGATAWELLTEDTAEAGQRPLPGFNKRLCGEIEDGC